mgnify:FL=1
MATVKITVNVKPAENEYYVRISATRETDVIVRADSMEEAREAVTNGGNMDLIRMWSEPEIRVRYIAERYQDGVHRKNLDKKDEK